MNNISINSYDAYGGSTISDCSQFKMNSDPKCKNQLGCKWKRGEGCIKSPIQQKKTKVRRGNKDTDKIKEWNRMLAWYESIYFGLKNKNLKEMEKFLSLDGVSEVPKTAKWCKQFTKDRMWAFYVLVDWKYKMIPISPRYESLKKKYLNLTKILLEYLLLETPDHPLTPQRKGGSSENRLYNFIYDIKTGKKYKINSKKGKTILNKYIKF